MRLTNRLLTALLLLAAAVGSLAVIGPVTGLYRTTTVLTGSMRPTIDPGDVVVAVPVASDDVEEGDIVTFRRPDSDATVTHRVVKAERVDGELRVTTKGDANEAADTYDVKFIGDTAWRTQLIVPKVGYVFVWARAVLEQSLFLPTIGILLFGSLMWSIWRPTSKESDAVAA